MKISILTIFPEMFDSVLSSSILKRSQESGLLVIDRYNIRDYTLDKHRRTDDYPFGGGQGMLMTAQPIFDCMADVEMHHEKRPHRVYLSPRGKMLTSQRAETLAQYSDLAILCGHYEGVDQRVIDEQIDEELSIGDYVLTGGEIAAMVLIDAIQRFVPGVLGSEVSAHDESFTQGLLEYPQYTRPAEFRGLKVPEVLLSGNHKNIEQYKRQQALLITKKMRPDLLKTADLSAEDIRILEELE